MPVEFHDYSVEVKGELENAATKWLFEAADELTAQTQRRTSQNFKEFRVKESWNRAVDIPQMEAVIGSNTEAAFWEELGTGEYAINHDGRRGWWVFCEEHSNHPSRQKVKTQEEAEETAEYLRAKGLKAHATNGTEANRPLFKAFEATKAKIIRRAEEIFKGL